MSIYDLSLFIDNRNKIIWDQLNEQFNISLDSSTDDTYICYTQGKNAIIYIPDSTPSKDAFTHELLHIYLRSKQIFIGSSIANSFKSDEVLSLVYDELLVEHIGNCLDHHKMFPIYLELDFERTKFINDYSNVICSESEISLLKNCIRVSRDLLPKVAAAYLQIYFAIKATPNNSINYDYCLSELKKIDAKLFYILENFWNEWDRFDINNGFCIRKLS